MEKGVKMVKDPDKLMAEQITKAIRYPTIEEFINVGNESEIISLSIDSDSDIIGKTIHDINIPKNSLIISIERDDNLFIPQSNGTILEGDKITLLTTSKQVDKIINLFSTKE
jgi:Trk K+ transport system NAD-binding subunit